MTAQERRGRLGLPGVDRVLRSETAVAMIEAQPVVDGRLAEGARDVLDPIL